MDKQVIQSTGFRNIEENGNITGFQLKVRLPYYRGVFVSQIRPGTLYVDDLEFDREDLKWIIRGKEFTFEELKHDFETFWAVTEPATIVVEYEGGLEQGFHDLKLGFCFTSSYMPPMLQNTLDPDKESFVYMPEFGYHVNERKLLIV